MKIQNHIVCIDIQGVPEVDVKSEPGFKRLSMSQKKSKLFKKKKNISIKKTVSFFALL